jgi:drug/metabolite transporter (DMT)-like permease
MTDPAPARPEGARAPLGATGAPTAAPAREPGPMSAGGALAVASAVAFGATTPFVQRFGRGLGPFATAALLYGGASLFSALSGLFPLARPRPAQAALRPRDLPRLLLVASLGAVVAPVALAWGLQHTSGVFASLLLNLEAVFTVLLAAMLWHEPIGARAGRALVAMVAGGALLVVAGPVSGGAAGWGALAVVGATLAWSADNTVGRPLADRDPARVVLLKGGLGAMASAALAAAFGEPLPSGLAVGALVACGAIGYGASLTLYLRAQRAIGAARTGSIFAVAPFVGAMLAWAMGQRAAGVATVAAGALFAMGVWLHLTEGHEHPHTHDAVEHEHAHSHDDRHHLHTHDVFPRGPHSHPHRHDAAAHAHPHGLDVHHRHRH